ncbi:MAG: hypothetical protein HZC41_02860 [Chloroflexi bacterium]|nr:hypothetical protein [Chloroflexota bacterium]
MTGPVILAHGALGDWDEVIFLGVAVLFLVMMGISWFRSRSAPLEEPDEHEIPSAAPEQADDRFRLD